MSGQRGKLRVDLDEDQCVGFADIRRLFGADGELLPETEWPPEVACAVESVERFAGGFKIRMKPKVPALGRLLDRSRGGV